MKRVFLIAIEEHQAIIHRVCKMYRDTKEDQEDLFQEIVFQLWKSYPTFRGDSMVSTWMYRIALNTALASFRKNSVALEFKATLPIQKDVELEHSKNQQRMFEAFKKLSKAERAIIALYLEDYSYREISEIIGITENYVGVKMGRIRTKLRTIMNK
ncbi:MAG: sigma-70 family RNA polymerase sigma factor [Bacteroidota bacterium]